MDAPATEPRLASDVHDTVLHLALGALASLRRFEGLASVQHPGDPLAADDPVVLASLGLLACGRSLRRWLAEAAQDGPPSEAAADHGPHELLR